MRLAEPPPEEEEIRVRLVKDRVKETVTRTPERSRQGGKERLSSAHFIHFFVSAIDSDREAKKKNVNERGAGECGKGKQEVAIIRSFRWAKVGLSAP